MRVIIDECTLSVWLLKQSNTTVIYISGYNHNLGHIKHFSLEAMFINEIDDDDDYKDDGLH